MNQVDPVFQRAYGITYDNEKQDGVQITGKKFEELDKEFTAYLEERKLTEEEKA